MAEALRRRHFSSRSRPASAPPLRSYPPCRGPLRSCRAPDCSTPPASHWRCLAPGFHSVRLWSSVHPVDLPHTDVGVPLGFESRKRTGSLSRRMGRAPRSKPQRVEGGNEGAAGLSLRSLGRALPGRFLPIGPRVASLLAGSCLRSCSVSFAYRFPYCPSRRYPAVESKSVTSAVACPNTRTTPTTTRPKMCATRCTSSPADWLVRCNSFAVATSPTAPFDLIGRTQERLSPTGAKRRRCADPAPEDCPTGRRPGLPHRFGVLGSLAEAARLRRGSQHLRSPGCTSAAPALEVQGSRASLAIDWYVNGSHGEPPLLRPGLRAILMPGC